MNKTTTTFFLSALLGSLMLLSFPAQIHAAPEGRSLTARVVAIDQNWYWNRFGSYNPAGMMYALERDVVNKNNPAGPLSPGNVMLREGKRPRPLVLRANVGDTLHVTFKNLLSPVRPNAAGPATRYASMAVKAVTTLGDTDVARGIVGVAPGAVADYSWKCEREGAFLIWDNASPSGGQGGGGSMALGLFGTLICEPPGSKWYRSQVTGASLAAASMGTLPTGHPRINYEAKDALGIPILNMLKDNEIVHSDLDALIVTGSPYTSFREITVVFHDEIKAVQAFDVLNNPQLAGVRDGFAVNYSASGAGPTVLANRSGIGPAANCVDCSYEEFFLTSWANGDPGLVLEETSNPQQPKRVKYEEDPATVHHSYLNENVKFRNLHAGPKETHIFHLHAHQWLSQAGSDRATYLDSQTIAPFQSYSYEILYSGSGNLNRSAGDAIYHCHLYPHFAQGMWGLWRVHDVFEDGTRRLPDGELGPGTNPYTGETNPNTGTPIPAVVPMPRLAMAPMPTYSDQVIDGVAQGFPGYPFYIAGKAGHRPPQPPMDLVHNAGLPRHYMDDGDVFLDRDAVPVLGPEGDFSVEIHKANLVLLPEDGTPLEKAAMEFHGRKYAAGHPSLTPEGNSGKFRVNGLDPKPGAPYADPCDPSQMTGLRTYHVSAIELELVVNSHGWHDPQARINVLDRDVADYEGKRRTADPFFFRAYSGECIEFYHTNRTPMVLERDHFQVRTPTDTIGQHIHLVKFDVTSSDGSANGWNYEDGTFAKGAVTERLHAAKAGSVVRYDGGEVPDLPDKAQGYQTTVQRWWANPTINRLGEDTTIRTVFTHDHFAPSSIQQHGFYAGLVVEPAGSTWLKPDGTPMTDGVGTQAMIIGADDPETHPDYREFMVAYSDFALLYDRQGRPIDPPALPEAISVDHHSPYLINYKHEPLPLRVFRFSNNGTFLGPKAGRAGDMAFAFDSRVHGDPFTEIFRAFEGDRVQFRILQGGQEVQHMWTVHGLRWKRLPGNKNSEYVGAQQTGISEHFELDLPDLPDTLAANADYLYHLGSKNALWNGAWGILRTYTNPNQVRDLRPLPGNPTGNVRIANQNDFLGNGCPTAAPLKTFNVEAWAARDLLPEGAIVYNERESITDPTGLMFILAEDRAAYQAGLKAAEPLVIRANAGDCIQVRLSNRLPNLVPDLPGDAVLPKITAVNSDHFGPSNEVSIHPQLLSYDVRRYDGANVGFNLRQTASRGGTVIYNWYAGVISLERLPGPVRPGNRPTLQAVAKPEAFGVIPLRSFGDVIEHGSQGLIGALVIEPEGATWADPVTGLAMNSGTVAEVSVPGEDPFKEFVLLYQDGLNLRWKGAEIPDCLVCEDHYDSGDVGLNYRTEPHWARLGQTPLTDLLNVRYPPNWALESYKSIETPVFMATRGDRVIFRVTHPDGQERMRTFNVMGHDYLDSGLENFLSPGSSVLGPGERIDAELNGGARAGTWLYRDGPAHIYSGGAWGHFVVE